MVKWTPKGAKKESERKVLEKLAFRSPLRWSSLLYETKISSKTLKNALNRLIEKDLVYREVKTGEEYPPPVLYGLTLLGQKETKSELFFLECMTDFLREFHLLTDEDVERVIPTHLKLYSDSNITMYLHKDEIEKVRQTLFNIQSLFVDLVSTLQWHYRANFEKINYSQEEREKIEFYRWNIDLSRAMESRYVTSDVANSPQENEEIKRDEVERLGSWTEFKSLEEYINDPVRRGDFHKRMKGLPLTFEEFREFIDMEEKIIEISPLFDKYGEALERAIPKVCLMMYNWAFKEGMVKSSPLLINVGPDMEVRTIDAALDTLDIEDLERYRDSMNAFLKDPWGVPGHLHLGPEWPGESENRPRLPAMENWESWAEKILHRLNIILKSSS